LAKRWEFAWRSLVLPVVVMAWAPVAAFCGIAAAPILYDYGSSVFVDNNNVYLNSAPVATSEQYAIQAEQFADRTTEKEYFALTVGVPDRDQDRIEQPIGMHPTHRVRMAIRADHSTSREATTFYEVVERFDGFAAVQVLPKTGRTHQIRVHLAHIGCPVLCDKLYGGRSEITRGEIRRDPKDLEVLLNRQALHAQRIKLRHPETQGPIEFIAPLPADLAGVLEELRQYRAVRKR